MSTQNEKSPLTRNASGQENGTAIEARGLSSADNGMPAENLSQRKVLAPKQASEAANQRPSKENATAESIVDARAAGGNGTSSKVGRADALTVAAALDAYEKASIAASECDSIEEARIAFVHSILAAPPVEQPAAAPIEQSALRTVQDAIAAIETFEIVGENNDSREPNDEDRFILTEYIAHLFGGFHVDPEDREADEWCRLWPWQRASLASQPAPSPADERAAFEWPMLPRLPEAVITTADGEAVFTAHQMQGYANAYGEMVRARATAANETGAEGTDALAHEVWSAAQLASGEGIENGVQRIAAILSRSPTMATEPVCAWETDDGRVISDEQKQQALRDGGASASSVRPFSIALGRIGAMPAMAAEAVAFVCSASNDFAPIVRDKDAAQQLSDAHGDGKIVPLYAGAQADARKALTDALRRAREELSIIEWDNDPPARVTNLLTTIDALLGAHPGQPEPHETKTDLLRASEPRA